eukprot:UN05065
MARFSDLLPGLYQSPVIKSMRESSFGMMRVLSSSGLNMLAIDIDQYRGMVYMQPQLMVWNQHALKREERRKQRKLL